MLARTSMLMCSCRSMILRWSTLRAPPTLWADYLSREGAVAVTPEGSDQVEHVPLVALVVSDPVWPEPAAKQAELDTVPCAMCGDPGGFDNLAICSGCNVCMHLRCGMPPMSTVPSGDWLCPGCDL